jgi:hypothetical protein
VAERLPSGLSGAGDPRSGMRPSRSRRSSRLIEIPPAMLQRARKIAKASSPFVSKQSLSAVGTDSIVMCARKPNA